MEIQLSVYSIKRNLVSVTFFFKPLLQHQKHDLAVYFFCTQKTTQQKYDFVGHA